MTNKRTQKGFSKLSKEEKLRWLIDHNFESGTGAEDDLRLFQLNGNKYSKLFDVFSENTVASFPLPYSIAPNFFIDKQIYTVPMVTEESSVVAACAHAAKYWLKRGGFTTEVINTVKSGQVHFFWNGPVDVLRSEFDQFKESSIANLGPITKNMIERGGGILDIQLKPYHDFLEDYYTVDISFDTCDSMGANFINSILEQFASNMEKWLPGLNKNGSKYTHEINMSILSNYTPQCLVRAQVECEIEELGEFPDEMHARQFAEKFYRAVKIAEINPQRATTHNKGIFNGIDAVILATGNDFRAIEACGHTFASKDGTYRSLTHCSIDDDVFRFFLEVPMAIGTVGGLTNLHPLARRSLEMLGNPSAKRLMSIIAAVGLAQNFAAIRSLITTGIQRGHMKLHLMNMLHACGASPKKISSATRYFEDKMITFAAVRKFLDQEEVTD